MSKQTTVTITLPPPAKSWTEQALPVTMCPRCEARPGDRCRTISGKATSDMHSARWLPLAQAYADGYDAAEDAAG